MLRKNHKSPLLALLYEEQIPPTHQAALVWWIHTLVSRKRKSGQMLSAFWLALCSQIQSTKREVCDDAKIMKGNITIVIVCGLSFLAFVDDLKTGQPHFRRENVEKRN